MEYKIKEAMRAKEIAEKKMHNNDFVGAQKIALKAQQLYPKLDNVSQMLTLCQVISCSKKKILYSEMDWYGILQITPKADEASIKKKYKKFALLLHPDKNKFPGAEDAFKLISEAQSVLADPQRRYLYDINYMQSLKRAAPDLRRAYQSAAENTGAAPPPRQRRAYQSAAENTGAAPPPRQRRAHQPAASRNFSSRKQPQPGTRYNSWYTSEQNLNKSLDIAVEHSEFIFVIGIFAMCSLLVICHVVKVRSRGTGNPVAHASKKLKKLKIWIVDFFLFFWWFLV